MADTIAAISTGGGISAIGMIRVSGDGAIDITNRVFRAKSGIDLHDAEDRKLYYGELLDAEGNVIDICLCTVSHGPGSYTGEDTAELQCHGSPVVLAEGLRSLFAAGARMALAGEFTKRAFLNGCMDLSQAEAVIDLIDSETAAAARNAVGQLDGAISRRIDSIYSSLLDIMAHFHAVLDYPDEDIDEFESARYAGTLRSASDSLNDLLSTFSRGRILKEGIPSAIIGRPNTGKSSLLNAMLGYERAIVTSIAGTTRDTIEEKIRIGDLLLRLTDTAGIHRTDDTVEKLGVERSIRAAENAQLVLAVFDGSEPLTDEDKRVIEAAKNAPCSIAIINKSDLWPEIDSEAVYREFEHVCLVSAAYGGGIEVLENTIADLFADGAEYPSGEILTNARHADAVSRARSSIEDALDAIQSGVTPDAVLTSVEDALSALGEITGKTMREDITARIFERFCVGK